MRKLIVILKHKFISVDTITPILLEYNKHNSDKIILFFPHENDIIQLKNNFILYEALNKISSIKLLGNKNYFLKKLIKLYYFLFFIFSAFKGDKFIHFGELNNWPFKIISLINKNKTYFCVSNLYHDNYSKVRAMVRKRGEFASVMLNNDWSKIKPVSCDNLIVLSETSGKEQNETDYYRLHPKHKNKIFFEYGPSRLTKNWIDFSKGHVKNFFKKYDNIDPTKGYVVMSLSTFDPSDPNFKPNGNIASFVEILKVLKDLSIPTLIRPHYYTQMSIVKEELNKIDSKNLVLTYFHPTILALNAKLWICNIYSTTCADAYGLGVPVVEYTDYTEEILKVTKNNSINPQFVDHFILRNEKKLRFVVSKILSEDQKFEQRIFASDKNNLIKSITTK